MFTYKRRLFSQATPVATSAAAINESRDGKRLCTTDRRGRGACEASLTGMVSLGSSLPAISATSSDVDCDADAVCDRLAYILAPASSQAASLNALEQVLGSVASASVRLCLRARGAVPWLLRTVRVAVAAAASLDDLSRRDARLLHAAIVQTMALDAAACLELVTLAVDDLLDLALGDLVESTSPKSCSGRASVVEAKQDRDSLADSTKLLRRRRGGVAATARSAAGAPPSSGRSTGSIVSSVVWPLPTSEAIALPTLSDGASQEMLASDVCFVALVALRRSVRGGSALKLSCHKRSCGAGDENGERVNGSATCSKSRSAVDVVAVSDLERGATLHSSPTTIVLDRVVEIISHAATAWESSSRLSADPADFDDMSQCNGVSKAKQKQAVEHLRRGVHLVLLLDIAEACVAQGASERISVNCRNDGDRTNSTRSGCCALPDRHVGSARTDGESIRSLQRFSSQRDRDRDKQAIMTRGIDEVQSLEKHQGGKDEQIVAESMEMPITEDPLRRYFSRLHGEQCFVAAAASIEAPFAALAHVIWRTMLLLLDSDEQTPLLLLREVASAAMRTFYGVTQRHAVWTRLAMVDIFEQQPMPEQSAMDEPELRTQIAPSMLKLLALMLGSCSQDIHGAGAHARLAMGVLASIAAQNDDARLAIAGMCVSANFAQRILRDDEQVAGLASHCSSASRSPELLCEMTRLRACLDRDVNREQQSDHTTFLQALADAFARRRAELFSRDIDNSLVAGKMEARASCAVAAVLLGWLMHRDTASHALVAQHVGPTDAIMDVIRQFVVFQDFSGSLSNESLLSLHAVMLSVESHDTTDGAKTQANTVGAATS